MTIQCSWHCRGRCGHWRSGRVHWTGRRRAGVVPVYAEAPGPGSRGVVLPLAAEAQGIRNQTAKLNKQVVFDRLEAIFNRGPDMPMNEADLVFLTCRAWLVSWVAGCRHHSAGECPCVLGRLRQPVFL
jgi:hypothetical protein